MTDVDELRLLLESLEEDPNFLAKQKIMIKIFDKIDQIDQVIKEYKEKEITYHDLLE